MARDLWDLIKQFQYIVWSHSMPLTPTMSQWLNMFGYPCLLHLLVWWCMMKLPLLSELHLNLQGYLMNLLELECIVQMACSGYN